VFWSDLVDFGWILVENRGGPMVFGVFFGFFWVKKKVKPFGFVFEKGQKRQK
jgi:hypothetical protein